MTHQCLYRGCPAELWQDPTLKVTVVFSRTDWAILAVEPWPEPKSSVWGLVRAGWWLGVMALGWWAL